MGFVGCIPRFLKAHGGWILTALSAAGLIGTSVLVAKEAPDARDALEDEVLSRVKTAVDERYPDHETMLTYEEVDEIVEEAQLTLIEKAGIVLPIYLPAILVGTGTIVCMFGAQIFNVRQQAAMVAAYGALMTQFNQYRQEIRNEYGEEADRMAFLQSRQEVQRLTKELREMKEENGPFLYEFATLPGIIFEARPAQIVEAILHYNRNMTLRGYNDLAELYHFAGIPESCYNKEVDSQYGWQIYENDVDWGAALTDFTFKEVKNKYGRTVNVIDTLIPPYEVNVDYGFEGDVTDRVYPGYNLDMAIAFAEELGPDEFIEVSKDHYCYIRSLL